MRYFFVLAFVSVGLILKAQDITVSGYVQDAATGERLPASTIMINSTNSGVVANSYGFFSITALKGDSIVIRFIGYHPLITKVENTAEDPKIFMLKPQENLLNEVVVTNKAYTANESEQMSLVSIPLEQIETMPVLLGEKDVLKSIQLFPGVQTGREGSAGIYVRGGGPDQNLLILDDAVVYNAFHMFGFFSVFNTDAISSVDLYKGGFPARFGGRLSSVVDMKMKDGNRQEWKGEGGIGLLSSRLTVEGPLVKNKSSLLISARRSYADLFAALLSTEGNITRINFGDLNAKINYDISKKGKLILSAYMGRDKFLFRSGSNGIKDENGYNWGNVTTTLRWNRVLNPKLFVNTSIIYSSYKFNVFERITTNKNYFEQLNSSSIRDFTGKAEFDFFANPGYSMKFGLVATKYKFSPQAITVKNTAIESDKFKATENYSGEYAGYIENFWSPSKKFQANIGLRYTFLTTGDNNYQQLQPRFSGAWHMSENSTLKGSFAVMQQNIHLLSASGTGLPTDLWVSSTDKVQPQKSWQLAFGYTRYFDSQEFEVTAETYYKEMSDIIAYKDGASFLFIGSSEGIDAEPINWEENITPGNGTSYGIEVLLHRKRGRLNGWIGYTLSYTRHQFEEINDGEGFWARHDRRHDISVVSSYAIRPNLKFNVTWVYGTGNAITLPRHTYRAYNHDYFHSSGGNIFATDYGKRNSFRAAPYHRLDVSLQFTKKKKWGERTWEIGLYNAYLRSNPFFYETQSSRTLDGYSNKLVYYGLFPVVPSVSYNFKF